MALSRRTFLRRVASGIAGACVVAHVPVSWCPSPIKSNVAIAYLRKGLNDYIEAHRAVPTRIECGRALYEALEVELQSLTRLIAGGLTDDPKPTPFVWFKGVRTTEHGKGWSATYVSA